MLTKKEKTTTLMEREIKLLELEFDGIALIKLGRVATGMSMKWGARLERKLLVEPQLLASLHEENY